MTAPRINNRDCRPLVDYRTTFMASNIYAAWYGTYPHSERYVVYSYGPHFPMYIWVPRVERWFYNTQKYSTTTSRHQSQAMPSVLRESLDNGVPLDTRWMHMLADNGYPEMARLRLRGAS